MLDSDLTEIMQRYQQGDTHAFERLVELVYDKLRHIAHAQLGSHQRDAVVNTTVIVHEAYFRLRDQEQAIWQNRAHFMAVAATAMRQIIVDFARRQNSEKRGGGVKHVDIDSTQVGTSNESFAAVLDIDTALTALSKRDQRAARLFEARFFGGMTDEEAADALGMSLRTTQREWRKVKAYFAHALA